MDLREYTDTGEENFISAFRTVMSNMWFALPVTLHEDSDGHTVVAQPTIKRAMIGTDGKLTYVDHPLLQDVPINHHGGGGVTVTHPHKKGDEGIVVFASRPIDSWHESGGTQQPIDNRMHSLSDGMYIPGIRSKPRKLSNVSTTSTQLRSDDGNHVVDLHPQNGITHTSSVKVDINAPSGTFKIPNLTHQGTLTVTKNSDGSGGNILAQNNINADNAINAPNGSVGS